MNHNEIKQKLEAALARLLMDSDTPWNLKDILLVSEDGDFDSVKALELIVTLETEFGIAVEDDDIAPENLRNFDCLLRFVENKLSGSA